MNRPGAGNSCATTVGMLALATLALLPQEASAQARAGSAAGGASRLDDVGKDAAKAIGKIGDGASDVAKGAASGIKAPPLALSRPPANLAAKVPVRPLPPPPAPVAAARALPPVPPAPRAAYDQVPPLPPINYSRLPNSLAGNMPARQPVNAVGGFNAGGARLSPGGVPLPVRVDPSALRQASMARPVGASGGGRQQLAAVAAALPKAKPIDGAAARQLAKAAPDAAAGGGGGLRRIDAVPFERLSDLAQHAKKDFKPGRLVWLLDPPLHSSKVTKWTKRVSYGVIATTLATQVGITVEATKGAKIEKDD